jgi:hypothetical protein
MATEKSPSSRKTSKSTTSGGDDDRPVKRASSSSSERGPAPRASASKKMSATQVAAAAARQLVELTGKAPEGVTGLERTDDGWKVHVEVVEVRRIPDTTDILAVYEVQVDADGNLEGYRRIRRYARGVSGED